MILLTGATGHLGSEVAKLLSKRGTPLRMLVREPSMVPKDVEGDVVVGDYGDSASLARAFDGVDVAFIVSASAPPGKRAELHDNVFRAAARAKVGHVVYLSLLGAALDSHYLFSRDHAESEAHLRATGLPCTLLRNGKYTEQLLEPDMAGDDRGVLRGPAAEAKVAWISRRDSARVIAALLPEPPRGVVSYTGPETLTLKETAERLTKSLGREIRFEAQTPEAALERVEKHVQRAGAQGKKTPAWRADLTPGSYRAIAAGEYGVAHDASRWAEHVETLEATVASGVLDDLR
jgi:NAD(P)H dehydrogenase (quinone)